MSKRKSTQLATSRAPASIAAAVLAIVVKSRDELADMVTTARKQSSLGAGPSSTLDLVRKAQASLRALGESQDRLSSYETELVESAERNFQELDSTLHQACTERGWAVDGHWPTLYVQRGVTVEIDVQRRTAVIGGKRIGHAEISAIVALLEPQVAQLIPKSFDPQSFIRDLASSYDRARRQSDQVPIFDAYREYVIGLQDSQFWRDATNARFAGLGPDQFRARISRMLECGVVETPEGRTLKLFPPLNPKDGLFIYLPSEARFGYVGRLAFQTIA